MSATTNQLGNMVYHLITTNDNSGYLISAYMECFCNVCSLTYESTQSAIDPLYDYIYDISLWHSSHDKRGNPNGPSPSAAYTV